MFQKLQINFKMCKGSEVELLSLKYIWAFYTVFFVSQHILQVCYVFVVMFRGHEDIPTLLGP